MAEFKHLVRIANTDLKGEKQILFALQKIKGISHSLANAICQVAGVMKTKNAGELSNDEEKKLNEVLLNLTSTEIPNWMLNRRLDYETGEDLHLLGADIKFTVDNDKKREGKIKTYKGIRYQARLPVRGQRTKSNFRPQKGKSTVKKKVTVIRK